MYTYTRYEPSGVIVGTIKSSVEYDADIALPDLLIEGEYDPASYYIKDGIAVEKPSKPNEWAIFDVLTEQWIPNERLAKMEILPKRQELLVNSDWTQIPNGPLNVEQQQAWAAYRQELRDITKQSGYPFNVIWPTKPE